MTGELAAGALAGLAVAMPVGAIGAYLLGLAAQERFAVAAAAALGVASVDGAYALLAALGGAGLRPMLERAVPVLTVVATTVLVGLALRTLWAAVRRYRTAVQATARVARAASPGRAYLALVGLTAVNPATVLTFSAIVLGRPAAGGLTWLEVAAFAADALGASAACSCCWSAAAQCSAGSWPAAAVGSRSPAHRRC